MVRHGAPAHIALGGGCGSTATTEAKGIIMSAARSHALASIALLVWSAGVRGAPLERDVWYAFVDGDLRYGY